MAELLLATRNPGKARELAALLAEQGVMVRSLAEFPDLPDVVEDGETFEANALKKAREVRAATGLPVLADDSGLVVDALSGEPGVFSARYGGEGKDDAGRCRYLLERLRERGLSTSAARFHCTMALIGADGSEHVREATWEGRVVDQPRGSNGFGYDPLFEIAGRSVTAAELPASEKNRLSHRGQALQKVLTLLRECPALLG